jgi:hypothetical protein
MRRRRKEHDETVESGDTGGGSAFAFTTSAIGARPSVQPPARTGRLRVRIREEGDKGKPLSGWRGIAPLGAQPALYRFSLYPVLKIHQTAPTQSARNNVIMARLKATLTSALS